MVRGAGLAWRRLPASPLSSRITSTDPFFAVGDCLIRACWSHALFYCFFARFFLVVFVGILVAPTFLPEVTLIRGMLDELFL